jgi:hypothetical protein
MEDFNSKIDYMMGAKDCEDGVIHKSGNSQSYDEGYSSQYEYEQIETKRCE